MHHSYDKPLEYCCVTKSVFAYKRMFSCMYMKACVWLTFACKKPPELIMIMMRIRLQNSFSLFFVLCTSTAAINSPFYGFDDFKILQFAVSLLISLNLFIYLFPRRSETPSVISGGSSVSNVSHGVGWAIPGRQPVILIETTHSYVFVTAISLPLPFFIKNNQQSS